MRSTWSCRPRNSPDRRARRSRGGRGGDVGGEVGRGREKPAGPSPRARSTWVRRRARAAPGQDGRSGWASTGSRVPRMGVMAASGRGMGRAARMRLACARHPHGIMSTRYETCTGESRGPPDADGGRVSERGLRGIRPCEHARLAIRGQFALVLCAASWWLAVCALSLFVSGVPPARPDLWCGVSVWLWVLGVRVRGSARSPMGDRRRGASDPSVWCVGRAARMRLACARHPHGIMSMRYETYTGESRGPPDAEHQEGALAYKELKTATYQSCTAKRSHQVALTRSAREGSLYRFRSTFLKE
jgi:hypothetical protein